jgi:hypothetical protein
MNNNYHTQIDKPNNNILNEFAANNQLLQQAQQMQNFQGTIINRNMIPNKETQPQGSYLVPGQELPN